MAKVLKGKFIILSMYIASLFIIIRFYYFDKLDGNTLLSSIALLTSFFTPFINKDLEKYKTKLSSYTLVTKLQYDLEFKIYTEIYEKMFLLLIETDKLRPFTFIVDPHADDNINERKKSFINFYNETLNVINKYRPFYSDEIYLNLEKIKDLCYKEYLDVIVTNHLNFNYLVSNNRKKEIQKMLSDTSNLIKKRIENMKIIEE